MPLYAVQQGIEYYNSDNVYTTSITSKMTAAKYPTITICHAKFFSKEKMKGDVYLLNRKQD